MTIFWRIKFGYYFIQENTVDMNVTHFNNQKGMEKPLMDAVVWSNQITKYKISHSISTYWYLSILWIFEKKRVSLYLKAHWWVQWRHEYTLIASIYHNMSLNWKTAHLITNTNDSAHGKMWQWWHGMMFYARRALQGAWYCRLAVSILGIH